MKLGVVNEDIWDFFDIIHGDLRSHYETTLFERRRYQLPIFNSRINRSLLRRDLGDFLSRNDVVFFEWASELLALATDLPKASGIVVRMHRYDMYDWFDQINWHAVDRVVLVSEAKQRVFAELLPDHAHRTLVIPEAVSLAKYRPCEKDFGGNIGILCHLKPRKRVYDLVLTFYELLEQSGGLTLHIGGDMRPGYRDYNEALHSLVERLGIADKVCFYGYVEDPYPWYQNIDIFISNSYSEGLQVSPMEAIASGCYCLSHWWDGADELLPTENLYLTNADMKRKILEYCALSETEKRRQQRELRHAVEERFDIDKTKVEIRAVIEEVARSRTS